MTMFKNQNSLRKLSSIAVLAGAALLCASISAAETDEKKSPIDTQSGPDSSQDTEVLASSAADEATIDAVCGDEVAGESWLDRSYSYLTEQLCAPAVWFDGFFGDPRSLEENPVNSFIRVRSAIGWDQSEGTSGGLQVRANIVLPRLSDRIRLLVSRDEDVSGEGLDGLGLEGEDDKTRLGFRFILGEGVQGLTDVDATVRIESGSLNPRVSTRYRISARPSEATLVRGTQTAFWERLDGFGTQSRVDWEWSPRLERLVRWTTRGTFSEASTGVDWNSVLIAYQQLDQRTAIRADVGAFGNTRPTFETEEYFVSLRLRRQFLRPWLFVEFQPEHAWPLDSLTRQRRSDWRMTMTFEIQFENQPPSHRRRWDIQR
ncbi:MAG TPA: hypothetical protein VIC53_03845 [Wenzhouxiangella sp.]